MKYSEDDLLKLEIILENYKLKIEKNFLHEAISNFNKFFASFHKFFLTLCNEKIINEDPYGKEYDLDKLEYPDVDGIPYNEESYFISIRLTYFFSLLTHIKSAEILNIDSLTPDIIRKIIRLLNFLDWDRVFDPQPEEVNTEGLNRVLFNYQKERGQQFVISTLKASLSDILNYANELILDLEPVQFYLDENYKLWVRKNILTQMKFPPVLQGENIKRAHDKISKKIKESGNNVHIELIGEILKEDFTYDGEDIRKGIIFKLEDNEESLFSNKVEKPETPIEKIGKSLTELSKLTSQIESIIDKEVENSAMYRDEHYSILEKLLDYIKYNIFSARRRTCYLIKINEIEESKVSEKNIEFEKLISTVKELNKTLNNYKNGESGDLKELLSENEDEIEKIIHQLLSKSRYIYRHLEALDSFFRLNLNASKGIQIELKVLLSCIDKSQEIYFEYKKLMNELKLNSTTYKPGINLTT